MSIDKALKEALRVERRKAQQKTYYQANRQRILAYSKEYQKTHPLTPEKKQEYAIRHASKTVGKRAEYYHEWYMKNRERRKLMRAAKKEEANIIRVKGEPLPIDKEDVELSEVLAEYGWFDKEEGL